MLSSPSRSSDRQPARQASRFTPRPLLLIAITLYLLFNQFAAIRAAIPTALNGQADFRAYYAAGYIVRTHHAPQLYDRDYERQIQSAVVTPRTADLPFVYPPFSALLFAPLTLLSYPHAYFAFIAVNILLAILAAALLRQHLRTLTAFWPPLPYVLVLGFFPVAIALFQGQASLILLLCYCAAYLALKQEKPFQAGLFLALATIKFQIAIPVAILFLIWKRWRVVSGFFAGCLALATLSACIIGPQALLNYAASLLHIAGTVSTGTAGIASTHNDMFVPERMPNIHGLIAALFLKLPTTSAVTLITAALSLATFVWAARKPASLPLALLTAMLISYHMQPHDLTLMLLPLTLVLNQWLASPPTPHSRPLLIAAAIAILLLIPPIPLLLIGSKLSSLLVLPVATLALWIARSHPLQTNSLPPQT